MNRVVMIGKIMNKKPVNDTVSFTVAQQSGNNTNYIRCFAVGKSAEAINGLNVGDFVMLAGRARLSESTGNDGKKVSYPYIAVNSVTKADANVPLNMVFASGRLVNDPEEFAMNDGKAVSKFRIAIDVPGKEKETCFFRCSAFGKTAEFANKYLNKGQKIIIVARWSTGSYEKDGKKIYTDELIIDEVDFAESKRSETSSPAPQNNPVQPPMTEAPIQPPMTEAPVQETINEGFQQAEDDELPEWLRN